MNLFVIYIIKIAIMQENVFLIDICGTMFKSNTTFDFVRYYYGSNLFVKFWLSLPYRIYNRLMFRFFKKEPLRKNLISKLCGNTNEQLALMANDFCKNFLREKENQQVLNIINDRRTNGYRLVIVSATIDVIARAVAFYYNIPEYLSTTLKYDAEGVCMGKIDEDFLSCKKKMLKKHGFIPPYAGILTDNFSDCDVICESKESYIVTDKAKVNQWEVLASKYKFKSCKIVEV